MPTTSLGDIRDAITGTVLAAIPEFHGYDTVPEILNLPAFIVVPDPGETASFLVTMGRGVDTWHFELTVLVARNEAGLRQDDLDEFIYGKGPKSVREAIWNKRDLGIKGVDAVVTGVTGYGGNFEVARVAHVGAKLGLDVHIPLEV